jgi:hypothetical protein
MLVTYKFEYEVSNINFLGGVFHLNHSPFHSSIFKSGPDSSLNLFFEPLMNCDLKFEKCHA